MCVYVCGAVICVGKQKYKIYSAQSSFIVIADTIEQKFEWMTAIAEAKGWLCL